MVTMLIFPPILILTATVLMVNGQVSNNDRNPLKPNNDILPRDDLTNSVTVSVLFSIEDVNSVNVLTMDFRVAFFIEYFWKVPLRLCTDYLAEFYKITHNGKKDGFNYDHIFTR